MKEPKKVKDMISRRRVIQLGGKFLTLGMALPYLASCIVEDDTSGSGSDSDSDDSDDGDSTTSGNWASGGTELITVDYPETSVFTATGFCTAALSEVTTLGPCYFATTTGEDISEGRTGLPMQLCIRLIDSNCNPLSGYKIEVWHCDTEGLYSGDTSNSSDSSSFAGDFCTDGDSDAEASIWYRGVLETDSDGRVNFKTCFPGWYSGRTIHIHAAVVNSSNERELITQFCFNDDLCEEICTEHTLYKSRGSQDVPLSEGSDTVFPAYDYDQYMMTTSQNSDGSLLAYHTVQLVNV